MRRRACGNGPGVDGETTMKQSAYNATVVESEQRSIRHDLEELLRLQTRLIACELRQSWSRAVGPAVILTVAAAVAGAALTVLLTGVGLAIGRWIEDPGLGLIIVAIVAAILAAAAAAAAY